MKIYMSTTFPDNINLYGATISKTSYQGYLKEKNNLLNRVRYGANRASLFSRLTDPKYINDLYREKDKDYLRYLNDFKDRFEKYDVIVMNPGVDLVHPEFLHLHFKSSIKILHFIDDPHLTYSYGLPFSWAFDGATYISPSFSEHMDMKTLLRLAGFKWTKWIPHCVTNAKQPPLSTDALKIQLGQRQKSCLYVGGYYKGKEKRLRFLKKELSNDFDVFGRFPIHKKLLFSMRHFGDTGKIYRVSSLSDEQRTRTYLNYKIGINMHLSEPAVETGNARLYELPFHGLAQLADYSKVFQTDTIYEDGKEILLYRNIHECIELTRLLMSDDKLRCNIALKGYEKTIKYYTLKKVIFDFIQSVRDLG